MQSRDIEHPAGKVFLIAADAFYVQPEYVKVLRLGEGGAVNERVVKVANPSWNVGRAAG